LYNPNRRLCRPVLYNRRSSDPSRTMGGAVGVVHVGAISSSFPWCFWTPEMCPAVATSGYRCAAAKPPRIIPHTRGDASVGRARRPRSQAIPPLVPAAVQRFRPPTSWARVQNPKMWDMMRAVSEGNEELA
jgi:hypothetical protein